MNSSHRVIAQRFRDAMRFDPALFERWKALPKAESSVCEFVARVTGSAVAPNDLPRLHDAMQAVIDDELETLVEGGSRRVQPVGSMCLLIHDAPEVRATR